jgi:hypothetical protein
MNFWFLINSAPPNKKNLFDVSPPPSPPKTALRRSARDSIFEDDLDLFSTKSPNSIHTISTDSFLQDMEPANLEFEDDPMKVLQPIMFLIIISQNLFLNQFLFLNLCLKVVDLKLLAD